MKLAVGIKAFILNEEGKVLILREAKYDEGTNEGKFWKNVAWRLK